VSRPIVCRGASDRPAFALTYDDGPEPGGTDRLLDVLAASGVRATFFCVGEQVEDHPGLSHALVDAGHEVGCHTMRHLGHVEAAEQAVADMVEGATAIETELGIELGLYRAPYGQFVGATLAEAERRGWTCVGWNTHGIDWEPLSASAIASRIIDDLDRGTIVLLHDAQRYASQRDDCTATIEATRMILDEAQRLGLEPVTVGELLGLAVRG
jgi:peptidoglycan/xylan/chitin deacetylase (PgdA/CDA1 family)